jgi:tetratricopeptide (TPR) repeat protein
MNRVAHHVCILAGFAISLLVLAACKSAPKIAEPTDPLLAQYVSSAQSAYAQNSFARAARFYELALQRARAIDNSLEVGKQAYNLAAALHQGGRSADALPYLAEAESAFSQLRLDLGPVLLLRARALRATSDAAASEAAVRRVVELNTPRDVQAQAWLLYGRLAIDRGDGGEAEKALQRARALASDDPALQAGIAGLSARLALHTGSPAGAGAAFDREAEFFRRAGRFRDMAEALERAGDAFAASGAADDAGARYVRAARSYLGQGDSLSALRAIERALAAAKEGQEFAWGAEAAALFDEIRRRQLAGKTAEPAE